MAPAASVVPVLRSSVERLRGFVEGLTPEQLRAPAHPSEWTVADTPSHLGSGATLVRAGFEAFARTGSSAVPDGYPQSVWDEWSAKSPEDQARDALAADQALLATLDALSEEQRGAFSVTAGPLALDLEGALRLRFSEHVLHSWDIEVPFDPQAILSANDSAYVLPIAQQIAAFVGRTDGHALTINVRTTGPDTQLAVIVGPERVQVEEAPGTVRADLELPAEAFVRLVYGRLSNTYVPAGGEGAVLDGLRQLFPGF